MEKIDGFFSRIGNLYVLLRHLHRNFSYKRTETKQYEIVRFIINIRDQLHILRHQRCTQACLPNFISD